MRPGDREAPPGAKLGGEVCIVFDWDDTILPTTWLQKNKLLTVAARMRPLWQRQLAQLAELCLKTIAIAEALGNVIIITASTPGWVEQSCEIFLPSMLPKVRTLPCYAKPLSSMMMAFKVETFAKVCRSFSTVVSLGDGASERQGVLALAAPGRKVKSVKMRDMPTMHQINQQHELLQTRLTDVVSTAQDLDLRCQFNTPMPSSADWSRSDGGSCTLVHCTKMGPAGAGAMALPRLTPQPPPVGKDPEDDAGRTTPVGPTRPTRERSWAPPGHRNAARGERERAASRPSEGARRPPWVQQDSFATPSAWTRTAPGGAGDRAGAWKTLNISGTPKLATLGYRGEAA
mmetsp:Transcript_4312/g.9282  ORF Transcript_4312/g.9282 Transcript_4312/m.9282 type:complete len:345 (+) Transcript_4312:219-1253(+)